MKTVANPRKVVEYRTLTTLNPSLKHAPLVLFCPSLAVSVRCISINVLILFVVMVCGPWHWWRCDWWNRGTMALYEFLNVALVFVVILLMWCILILTPKPTVRSNCQSITKHFIHVIEPKQGDSLPFLKMRTLPRLISGCDLNDLLL